MSLYKYYPLASDRMGTLWTLCSIEGAYIVEFGPSGNTSFAPQGFRSLNAQLRANIFTTHITENEIALGNIDNLAEAIMEVDKKYEPQIIFILACSLVAVTGADIVGICAEIQSRVNAKLIPADEGGYIGDYTLGIRNTMKLLCTDVVENLSGGEIGEHKYNIIGSQIDYYNYRADVKEIMRLMKKYFNLECNTVFTSECSIQDIKCSADAEFNIIMRSEAMDAAQVLKERFDQPYIFGRPYGVQATKDFLQAVSETIGIKLDEDSISAEMKKCGEVLFDLKRRMRNHGLKSIISGNYDLVMGMDELLGEAGIENILGIVNHKLKGGNYEGATRDNMMINPSEEEIQGFISEYVPDIVLGDAGLLEMSEDINKAYRYQISNPNSNSFRFYDGTPFVGFNGVIYFCEVLCNVVDIEIGSAH